MSENNDLINKEKVRLIDLVFIHFLVGVFMHMTTPEEREELKKEVLKDLKGVC